MAIQESRQTIGRSAQVEMLEPFVQTGILYVLHDPTKHIEYGPNGEIIPTTKAIDYVSASGADPNIARRVFSEDGQLIYVIEQDFDINNNSLLGTRNFLAGTAEIPMDLINPSIAGPEKKVKNNHDLRHALVVTDNSLGIMTTLGTPMPEQAAGVVAAMLHDIGNILGRDPHAYFSSLLWRKFYPNLHMTEEQERIVDQAMVVHDGDVFYEILNELGNITFDEAKEYMRIELADPAKTLIIADKGALGIDRLPPPNLPEKKEDIHRVINLYGQTHELNYTPDLEHFYWGVNFGEGLTLEQLQQFPEFVVQTEDGEIVRKISQILKNGVEEFGTNEFEEWEKLFWAEYYPRNMLLVLTGLAAADPIVEDVNVVMRDISGSGPSESVKLYTFSADPQSKNYAPLQMYRIWQRLPLAKRKLPEYKLFANFWEELQRRKAK